MNKTKLIGSIVGVVVFIALIAGLTYAWYTWQGNNTTITGTSGCFTIDYVAGSDIGGENAAPIDPSITYTGGLSTSVQMGVNELCTITGKGTLYLNTDSTNTSAILLSGGVLKYQVVVDETPVASGTITEAGDKAIYQDFDLSSGVTSYTVYVWIDASLVDNSYVGTTYSGYIHASAVQNANQ